METKNNEIKTLTQKLAHEKQNSITILTNSEKTITQNKEHSDELVEKTVQQSKMKIDNLTLDISNLKNQIITLKSNEKKLISQLDNNNVSKL